MKKRMVRVILSVLLIMALSACQFGTDLTAEYTLFKLRENPLDTSNVEIPDDLIDNTTPYEELITKEVDIHDFTQTFIIPSRCAPIEEVMAHSGVECLRYTEKGAIYSIHTVKQGGLLYVFYNTYPHEKSTEITDFRVDDCFYVRKKMSSKDFKNIIVNESTIDDVIKIDKGTHIYKNINTEVLKEYSYIYPSYHYLDDGILEIAYENIDGELVVANTSLIENYDLGLFGAVESRYFPCYGKILEMDWP